TTVLTSSINPSSLGQNVTFTATVSGSSGVPTGSVVFTIDGTPTAPVNLNAGVATFSIDTLATGVHPVFATYGGSTVYVGSTSSTLSQTVLKATATTLVS